MDSPSIEEKMSFRTRIFLKNGKRRAGSGSLAGLRHGDCFADVPRLTDRGQRLIAESLAQLQAKDIFGALPFDVLHRGRAAKIKLVGLQKDIGVGRDWLRQFDAKPAFGNVETAAQGVFGLSESDLPVDLHATKIRNAMIPTGVFLSHS
jgi:hypothetical protein